MINTTKIVRAIPLAQFKQLVNQYRGRITVNPHAADQLSEAQRKVYKSEELIKAITSENSRGVGLQYNGRYAAFYRRTEGFLRIIIEKKWDKLEIITFTNPESMPNLKKLSNR